LLLRFKPNLTDPLPLYILLLLALPLILPLIQRNAPLTVGLSIALYMMVPLFGWNMPAYEGGGLWYFNPVAWQLLFVLGGACALRSESRPSITPPPRPLSQQPLFMLCASYALVAAVITFSWKFPELHDALRPQFVADGLYPINKTDLGPMRLLHFLALAYCVAKLLPAGKAWVTSWPARQACRMGRYSLEIFCFGVLLAPMADMVNALAGDTWPMQIFTALLGLGLMMLMAAWLDLSKRLSTPKPARAVAV